MSPQLPSGPLEATTDWGAKQACLSCLFNFNISLPIPISLIVFQWAKKEGAPRRDGRSNWKPLPL